MRRKCGGGGRHMRRRAARRQRDDAFFRHARSPRDDVQHVSKGRRARRIARRFVKSGDVPVELRHDDRTRFDWYDLVRTRRIETERRHAVAMIDDECHLVPVGARLVHPDRYGDARVLDSTKSLQRVGDQLAFPTQLRRIGEMLHLTAAADSENRAERFDPLRRFVQQFHQLADRIFGLDRFDANARALARNRTQDVDDHPVRAPHRLTGLRDQVGALDLDDVAGAEGRSGKRRGAKPTSCHRAA